MNSIGFSNLIYSCLMFPLRASHKYIKSEKSPTGTLIERYQVEEKIPIFNFNISVHYETSMEHAK